MAAWAHVLALTGFGYDAHSGALRFRLSPVECQWFWSTGDAWGTLRQTPGADGTTVELAVLGGGIRLRTITLAPGAVAKDATDWVRAEIADGPRRIGQGEVVRLTVRNGVPAG
jgi:hypothetical protein